MTKGLVLVSGASGYIGSHVVLAFLDAGYKVRGTVRSLSKVEKIKHLKAWQETGKALELVEADLTNANSWVDATKGVDYVAHVASPFFIGCKESEAEERLYKPARDGTLNVLKAAQASGVKRVVQTSSMAAIMGGTPHDQKVDEPEKLWSDVDKCDPYSRSKTIAEKAAWDFVKDAKESNKPCFRLSVINPTLVLGPPLSANWCQSGEIISKFLKREMPMLPDTWMGFVDVRDVARAHVLAIESESEEAEGRFACYASNMSFLAAGKYLASEFKPLGYNVPTTKAPYIGLWFWSFFDKALCRILKNIGLVPQISATKATKVLGLEYIDYETSLKEMGHSMISLGMCGVKKTTQYEEYENTKNQAAS